MATKQIVFIVINIIGGILVLLSYAYTFKAGPQGQNALWGGVPKDLRGIYTISMILSALSFFVFTSFLLFKVNPKEASVVGISAYIFILFSYLLILIPSAAWTPLTLNFIQTQKPVLWTLIRLVLFLVALGSLGVLSALLLLQPKATGLFYWSAVIGSAIFFLHVFVLDALIWPAVFKL